jgi:hypothetical protein
VASCRTDEDADTRHASLRTLLDWVRHRLFPSGPSCSWYEGTDEAHFDPPRFHLSTRPGYSSRRRTTRLPASMDQRLSQPNIGNQAHGKAVRVVTTRAVSGVLPDLPRYPSHTPNGQHFESTPLEAPRLATMAPFRQPAKAANYAPPSVEGRPLRRLHHQPYAGG